MCIRDSLQSDGENLSEGMVYIGKKRVRAEYFLPTKILIILDENKAMYYDYTLEEDEFFNPKNTNAWFFYDIFRNPLFFEDGKIEVKNNELLLEKKGIDNEEKNFVIRVLFENSTVPSSTKNSLCLLPSTFVIPGLKKVISGI